jgi:uncharacterized membrane protein YgcG
LQVRRSTRQDGGDGLKLAVLLLDPPVEELFSVWRRVISMGKRLYVGNLPWSFSSADLSALFAPYGTVKSAEVISDRETGRSRGFGFVELETQEAMEQAISALHESDMQGRALTVNEARERTGGGGGGGGGGGRGRGGYGGGGGGGGGGGYGGGRGGRY